MLLFLFLLVHKIFQWWRFSLGPGARAKFKVHVKSLHAFKRFKKPQIESSSIRLLHNTEGVSIFFAEEKHSKKVNVADDPE